MINVPIWYEVRDNDGTGVIGLENKDHIFKGSKRQFGYLQKYVMARFVVTSTNPFSSI